MTITARETGLSERPLHGAHVEPQRPHVRGLPCDPHTRPITALAAIAAEAYAMH